VPILTIGAKWRAEPDSYGSVGREGAGESLMRFDGGEAVEGEDGVGGECERDMGLQR
jgi:hypothetical protein